MSDYTPSWELDSEAEFASRNEYPAEFTHGGGVEFEQEWEPTAVGDSGSHSPPRVCTLGKERHPEMYLATGAYFETVSEWEITYCEGHGFTIEAESETFPPDDEVDLHVYGTRVADADTVSATVRQAGPLTLTTDEMSGTLYRLFATGCLLCGGEAE